MKAFLICPVRGHDASELQAIVTQIEREGYMLHFPPRDTDQKDETGFRICCDNRAAILASDVVFIVWDGKSQGCLFDLGIAFALEKPIIPISLPEPSEGKSFQNMIRAWATKAGCEVCRKTSLQSVTVGAQMPLQGPRIAQDAKTEKL